MKDMDQDPGSGVLIERFGSHLVAASVVPTKGIKISVHALETNRVSEKVSKTLLVPGTLIEA